MTRSIVGDVSRRGLWAGKRVGLEIDLREEVCRDRGLTNEEGGGSVSLDQ